jgi:6-pyruvoyltetrahydropterin/6-carboxytetrahydropterin synthase
MICCTRRLTFAAGHRLLGHAGKCRHPHGHNYAVEIMAEGSLDQQGRVIDFGVIKEQVGGWIDAQLDHAFIVHAEDVQLVDALKGEKIYQLRGNPTAENIAEHLLSVSQDLLLPHGVRVRRVRVYETDNCYADAMPDL